MWRDVNTLRAELLLVYFRLGRLQRVYTYVQQMWGIIGHVTVEAGNTVGTDGAPPHKFIRQIYNAFHENKTMTIHCSKARVYSKNKPCMLSWLFFFFSFLYIILGQKRPSFKLIAWLTYRRGGVFFYQNIVIMPVIFVNLCVLAVVFILFVAIR